MTLTTAQRKKIIAALMEQRKNYDGSDKKFGEIYALTNGVFSRLKGGETEKVVSDEKLITIGRKLQVNFTDAEPWVIVNTETYRYIYAQLNYCQQTSEARILVDIAGIGKTTTARQYALNHKNVFYVDCSQVKNKRDFVRELAKTVGISTQGRVQDVIKDTIYLLQLLECPLVILDEAGDLAYDAWLEVKRYWNALEDHCGWYMMGADGLKAKIESHVRSKKVGYAEIFDRFGKDFKKATPNELPLLKTFLRNEAKLVASANLKDQSKINSVIDISEGLRRVKANVKKANRVKSAA